MSLLNDVIQGMIDMFFPEYCVACGKRLLPQERFLCLDCDLDLSTITFDNFQDNTITRLFWGRIPLQYAFAFMHFVPNGPSQAILHELKYKHNKDIGYYYGELMAYSMKDKGFPEDFDIVLPVPLHPKKQYIRGYNQAELLATRIARLFDKKLETKAARRSRFNPTQTRKSMTERWENVRNLFEITNSGHLQGKHILIIDDVITTGSTIESLATEILKIPGVTVSAAFLAMAQEF